MMTTKECLLNKALYRIKKKTGKRLTLKDEQNLWSQEYSQRLCHSQHNVKLSIITSVKQCEAY
jgi:hypothetical protein